jgi:hypothetical protein
MSQLVEVSSDVSDRAQKADKLSPFYRRPAHLAGSWSAEQDLANVAAGRQSSALGGAVDGRTLVRREANGEVAVSGALLGSVTHGTVPPLSGVP